MYLIIVKSCYLNIVASAIFQNIVYGSHSPLVNKTPYAASTLTAKVCTANVCLRIKFLSLCVEVEYRSLYKFTPSINVVLYQRELWDTYHIVRRPA